MALLMLNKTMRKKALRGHPNYILVQFLAYLQLRTLLIYIVISGCPSIVPGASTGVIYSPNFPLDYPNSKLCEWNITVPWHERIYVKFTKFNLEPSYGHCDDYVEVLNNYGNLIGKYCGSRIPSIISSYGSIRVRFVSDFLSFYPGFMAVYQIGYSFPTTSPYPYQTTYPYWTSSPYSRPHTFYWTTSPPIHSPSTQPFYACRPYSQTSMLPIFNTNFVHAFSKYKYQGPRRGGLIVKKKKKENLS